MESNYEYWNGPLGGVRSPIFMDSIAPDDGFTAVILAYERIESLYRVIEGTSSRFILYDNEIYVMVNLKLKIKHSCHFTFGVKGLF